MIWKETTLLLHDRPKAHVCLPIFVGPNCLPVSLHVAPAGALAQIPRVSTRHAWGPHIANDESRRVEGPRRICRRLYLPAPELRCYLEQPFWLA